MKSTYKKEDVTLLLKDITGLVTPLPTKEREQCIQNGIHYSEMLPLEYKPSSSYMEAYYSALSTYAETTAFAVCSVAEKIYTKKGDSVVLVSLARAGTPIGILIKHYLKQKYNINVPHFSISIIRGKGIDKNAIRYILSLYPPESIQFVDGWIGKGAIQKELQDALSDFKEVSTELAVLSDPAYITKLCGTHEDILIPSSCLNCTVSGLVSRTFFRSDLIHQNDFHGAAYYGELEKEDLSYHFIDTIEQYFTFDSSQNPYCSSSLTSLNTFSGQAEVNEIAAFYGISERNFIKPGIGEATRVLLRRVPWKLLICENSESDSRLRHLIQLAQEKSVPIDYYPLKNYKACGIIKQLADA